MVLIASYPICQTGTSARTIVAKTSDRSVTCRDFSAGKGNRASPSAAKNTTTVTRTLDAIRIEAATARIAFLGPRRPLRRRNWVWRYVFRVRAATQATWTRVVFSRAVSPDIVDFLARVAVTPTDASSLRS